MRVEAEVRILREVARHLHGDEPQLTVALNLKNPLCWINYAIPLFSKLSFCSIL
jgi:hypothetical protein